MTRCCWFCDDMDFRPLEGQQAEFDDLPRTEKCTDCPGAPTEPLATEE